MFNYTKINLIIIMYMCKRVVYFILIIPCNAVTKLSENVDE